jgi:hypothetical protein
MKKYYIIVIYPGMYEKTYDLTGNLNTDKPGFYYLRCETGSNYYFPIDLTIIEEVEND